MEQVSGIGRSCGEPCRGVPRLGRESEADARRRIKAAIASSDRFDYFLAVVAIKGLRDGMSELLSHLGKNWAKVHNPKNLDSTGGMY